MQLSDLLASRESLSTDQAIQLIVSCCRTLPLEINTPISPGRFEVADQICIGFHPRSVREPLQELGYFPPESSSLPKGRSMESRVVLVWPEGRLQRESIVIGTNDRDWNRAAVFCLGTMLWELLAGEALFTRSTRYETRQAILRDNPSRLLRAPQSLMPIIEKSLSKSPEDRYTSPMEFAHYLTEWIAGYRDSVLA